MKQVFCSLKNCNVTIWRESISARSLEDVGDAMIHGRYCCSDNDYQCEHDNGRCALKKEMK